MKNRISKIRRLLISLMLMLAISFTALGLTSCSFGKEQQGEGGNNGGTGNNGDNGNSGNGENTNDVVIPQVSYGTEYKQAMGDMNVNTKLAAGIADVITDKHLIFTAGVESFEGLRIGHGYEEYTACYVEIDNTSIKYYQYTDEHKLIKEAAHGLTIKSSIKVTIDVNNRRVATITLESGDDSFSFSTGTNWYGSNGSIFAESLGSVLKGARLAFTADGYKSDIQFYGDSYLSQSSDRWLNFAFNDNFIGALYDGFGGRDSSGAYASLFENLRHSTPNMIVWMMGMNDGSDTDINTPSATWATNRDKIIALSDILKFEVVFTTIPTVPGINHEAKNKWIRESGYRYIDMAAALGADGTGAWTEGYLHADNVHPTALGSEAIYEQVKRDLFSINQMTFGNEYKQASGDMNADTKLSLGRADIIIDKHLVFLANITSFEGIRLGHGYTDYTGDYIEIDETSIKHYQYLDKKLPDAKLVKEIKHGLDIKDYIKVTINVDAARNASIVIYTSGNSYICTMGNWYGANGDIYATSLGSVLTDAQLAFTCDGYQDDIHFYGDSYLSQSSDRWLYAAFKDGLRGNALFDGYGGRGSGGAYASLVENLKHSSPEIVVWMMGMNDGSDKNINTPSAAWATNRDKLIALSEEYGFEIVFTTIPTVPAINHEAKNKWIRESGYRYIDMAAGLGADGTGAWTEGYLSGDKVHPSALGAGAIYNQVIKDLPEFKGESEEE